MNPCLWTAFDGQDTAQADLQAIRDLLASHPASTLDHDPDWLTAKARAHQAAVRIYVCRDSDGALIGYAPFYIHNSVFDFSYAGLTLWRYPIRRHSLTAQPLLQCREEDRPAVVQALVDQLGRDLGRGEVMFLLGLHLDSPLGGLMASGTLRRRWLILPQGPEYTRRLAKVAPTLDGYLAQLGAKTRQDLRRQERRLLKHTDDAVRVSVYHRPDAMEEFLDAVEHISRRTYQWHLLDMGIRKDAAMTGLLNSAAARGWLRGYVLYARDQPIAFMIGYLYRQAYLSESIGYDPEWSEWSVGNVLHLHVMRDLAQLGDGVEWFDFMYGDNANKARLGTHSRAEGNFYLIPDTLRWRGLVAALKGFNGLTRILSEGLERHGLKDRIRRILRRRATQAALPPPGGD